MYNQYTKHLCILEYFPSGVAKVPRGKTLFGLKIAGKNVKTPKKRNKFSKHNIFTYFLKIINFTFAILLVCQNGAPIAPGPRPGLPDNSYTIAFTIKDGKILMI